MTEYLIRTLTDSTGQTFPEVIKSRDNETFTVVEAENKAQALEKVKEDKKMYRYIKYMSLLTLFLGLYELLRYYVFKNIDVEFEISEFPVDYEISKWR